MQENFVKYREQIKELLAEKMEQKIQALQFQKDKALVIASEYRSVELKECEKLRQ